MALIWEWLRRNSFIASALVLLVAIGIGWFFWLRVTTVVLIIRHAERNDAASCSPAEAGPPLSETGEERAQALVHVLEEAGITRIYASEFCRTQQTVQPIATQLGLPVTVVDQISPDGAAQVDSLIEQIRANDKGKVILIAGHTNTIPVTIEKLGGGTIEPVTESEFDNLYIVIIPRFGRIKLLHMKYGSP